MKKWLLILIILLTSGCDVVYNIDIDESIVTESTNIYFEQHDFIGSNVYNSADEINSKDISELVDKNYNRDYLALNNPINDEYYKKKKINDNIGDGINLSYDYTIDNYYNSSLINYCISNEVITENDKYIIVDVKDFGHCFYKDPYELLSSLTINVKTEKKVLDNNADSINKNVYTWTINKDNINKKNLFIKIRNEPYYGNDFIVILIIFIFLFLINFFVYFVRRQNKANNEI